MHVEGHAHERGANLVEAALVIPLLLILMATVVDFGRVYFAYITIIDAAREGARYGAGTYGNVRHYDDVSGIVARVRAEAASNNVDLTSASITVPDQGPSGYPVRVTVVMNYPLIMGGVVGQPSFTLRYSMAFRAR